jgi:UDPglucose 6-dehydrogenase
MSPKLAYVGMTHLGLCSAVAAASKGFSTLCFDPDPTRVAAIKAGTLPVVEPGLDDLFAANTKRLSFSADPASLFDADLVYVAPDVPTDDDGGSDLGPIRDLLSLIEPHLGPDAITVVLSQVPPGFSRAHALTDRPFFYQVETLVFGRAVERATEPERFIVGCANPEAPLPGAMAAYLDAFGCPVLPMRYESAELAKISINFCLVASVTVANTLAEVCEKTGADWSEIVPALKLDRRIGEFSYLTAGLGISGGNLERDLTTVDELSRSHGTEAGLITAFQKNSAHRKSWPLRKLHHKVLDILPGAVIGVLGLSYKENTHSVKNSPSLALLAHLHPWSVRLYDPVVPADAAQHPKATQCSSPIEAATGVDALVLMTPWPEFRNLNTGALAKAMKGKVLIDPYRLISPDQAKKAGFDHITLGTR